MFLFPAKDNYALLQTSFLNWTNIIFVKNIRKREEIATIWAQKHLKLKLRP